MLPLRRTDFVEVKSRGASVTSRHGLETLVRRYCGRKAEIPEPADIDASDIGHALGYAPHGLCNDFRRNACEF